MTGVAGHGLRHAANRAFLGRAVRYLAADAGMRQFLDIGTGIPTSGNAHEIVQAIAPRSRLVYVDYDRSSRLCARALDRSGCLKRTREREAIRADIQSASKRPKLGASKRMSVGCCKCTN
jgi:hypothetical protein